MREMFNKLVRREEENFDQDTMVLRQLLRLSPDRMYTLDDLNDNEIHDSSDCFTVPVLDKSKTTRRFNV